MKPIHKFIYFLMNVGAVAIALTPIMLAKYFELSNGWEWGVMAFSAVYYMGLTGFGSTISLYRASKEIEFEEQNKPRIEPYF